ncbi:murein L,D-transpeptidase catalytic domain family protein [Legionella oakridgensis]|nr:murein L,D-transpeptidase catalytic domain family protein [Legionella oakridgensis]
MNTIFTLISVALLTSNMTSSTPSFAKPAFDVNTEVKHLSQKAPTLDKKVLKLALAAYQKAKEKGKVKKPVLTVIDYSLPSSKQRMWVFDVNREKLLYNTHVAHGKNSGLDIPHHFSNTPSSKATSLGTYVTRDTYFGSKGYSLNLQGLEKGFNDNAYSRRVVIHGAWYVEPSFIKRAGRAGRSWGCPSIAQTLAKPVINTIKGGSIVFAYYPDRKYLSHSGYAAVA